MSKPLASCLMLTYGRVRWDVDGSQLLNEAVESFLRQTYENCELIILNDACNQEIVFDHPRVKVVNSPSRFETLGDKRNAAINIAQGDILLVWDDDDISLPNRVEATVRHFEETDADYASTCNFWFSQGNTTYDFKQAGNTGAMAGASYRRSAVEDVPYRSMDSGEDQTLVGDMRRMGKVIKGYELPVKDTPLIYRWNFLATHISGYGDSDGYNIIGRMQLPPLKLKLKPFWDFNYTKICQEAAANL